MMRFVSVQRPSASTKRRCRSTKRARPARPEGPSTLPAPLSSIGTPQNQGARSVRAEAMRRSGTPHPGRKAWRRRCAKAAVRHAVSAAMRAALPTLLLILPIASCVPALAGSGPRRAAAGHRRARHRRRRAAGQRRDRRAAGLRGRGHRLARGRRRLRRQRQSAGRRPAQPGRARHRLPHRHAGRPDALARLPRPGGLLRGAHPRARTASARSPRSCSTGSATRPGRTASAASSTRGRCAPAAAASSPSPATARWRARRCGRSGRGRGCSPPRRWPAAPMPRVGLSTIYHTNAVFPAWAPRLVKTAMIGAHNLLPPAGPRRRAGRVQRRLCRQRAGPAAPP